MLVSAALSLCGVSQVSYYLRMPELAPDQSDPFLQLRPEDFEPPVWEGLSPAVLEALKPENGGPGIVTDPATQHEFTSLEELIPADPAVGLKLEGMSGGISGMLGIASYFAPGAASRDDIPDFMRKWPVFRRFQIMHPDLVDSLMQRMEGVKGMPPPELHKPLFNAYRIMRHLVDKHDPYIAGSDGRVDDLFLIR